MKSGIEGDDYHITWQFIALGELLPWLMAAYLVMP